MNQVVPAPSTSQAGIGSGGMVVEGGEPVQVTERTDLVVPDPERPGWATIFSLAVDPMLGKQPLLKTVLETVRWTKIRSD